MTGRQLWEMGDTMPKIKQLLFTSLFVLPPLLFLTAAFLPLLSHRPPQIAYVGLVPLALVVMWQAYRRGKIFPR